VLLRRRDDQGAAAVEFALVMPLLLIIVFALIQYGMYFYSAQTGSNTVNVAARQLTVGNCDTSSELNTLVSNRLGAAKVGTPVVTRKYYDTNGTTELGTAATDAKIGGTVKVEITFATHNLNFPFVPFLEDPKVYRTVTARVEDTTDQGCGA
jgi:Flp pilus assembly protein TadG